MKLLATLRNVASADEGAVATAASEFSTDFPASGAIDGDKTHINFGPASGADNGIGKSGWKSGSTEFSNVKTTAADWNGGTQTRVETVADSVELVLKTSRYQQDFNSLNTAPLATQDLWVSGGGTALIEVDPVADFGGGGKGVRLRLSGGGNGNVFRPVTFGTGIVYISFRIKAILLGTTNSYLRFDLEDSGVGARALFFTAFDVSEDASGPVIPGRLSWPSGLASGTDVGTDVTVPEWHKLVFRLDRTTPASTVTKMYFDGRHVKDVTVDTTGIDRIRLHLFSSLNIVEYYFDELRIGDDIEQDGTQDNVIDLVTAPTAAEAKLEFNGENARVERLFAGVYPITNNNTDAPLRDVAGNEERAQVWRATATGQVDGVYFELRRIGTPVGNVVVELRKVVGGLPSTTEIFATSEPLLASTIPIDKDNSFKFTFPFPFTVQSGTDYAYVFKGTFAINGSSHIIVLFDTTGTLSHGEMATFNGTSWATNAGDDIGFASVAWHQPETLYAVANQDSDAQLGRDATNHFLSQGFKVPFDVDMQHFQVLVKVPTGVTFDSGDRFFLEADTGFDDDRSGLSLSPTVIEKHVKQAIAGASTDLTQHTFAIGIGQVAFTIRYVQTFTPTENATVGSLSVELFRFGTLPAGVTVRFAIFETAGGDATFQINGGISDAIFAFDIANNTIEEGGPKIYNFVWSGLKPTLIAGRQYALEIIITRTGSNARNFIAWRGRESWFWGPPDYLGGDFRSSDALGGWHGQIGGGTDLGFVLFTEEQLIVSEGPPELVLAEPPLELDFHGYDPSLVGAAGGPYVLWTMSLPAAFRFEAGRQYYLKLKTNWLGSASKFLHIGFDASAPSYVDGRFYKSDQSDPVVWSVTLGDMIFTALGEHKPFIRWDAAFSDDNVIFTAFENVFDNPGRVASRTGAVAVEFTGQAKRFWKIRADFRRKLTDWVDDLRWTPTLFDYTLRVASAGPKALNIDFLQAADATRKVRGIEIFGHPFDAGIRKFRLEFKTTDAGPLTQIDAFVDVDERLSLSRKKGGDATIAASGSDFEMTGDYAFIVLNNETEMTDLQITVLDTGGDAFARILEVNAFRVIDMTDRVAKGNGISLSADTADFTFREPKAKVLTLTLTNADHNLSVLRTEGGFNAELGDMVRFFLWWGFEGTELIQQGEFYVSSEWQEVPAGAVVTVTAKDLAFLMDTERQARSQVDFQKDQIIEYFANLAGIPSQFMILDFSSGIVDFMPAKEINVWDEIQKVSQSAALGLTEIRTDGYLEFRATGNTARDTRLEDLLGAEGTVKTSGAAVLAGKIYWLAFVVDQNTGFEDIKVVEYDLTKKTWALVGKVNALQLLGGRGGLIAAFAGELFILTWETESGDAVHPLKLYRWDGIIPGTFTLLANMDFGPGTYKIPGEGAIRNGYTSMQDGAIWRICLGDADVNADHGVQDIDLVNFTQLNRGAIGSSKRAMAIAKEGSTLMVVTRTGTTTLKAEEWNATTNVFTERATLSANGNTTFYGISSTQTGRVWMAAAGDGSPANFGVLDELSVPGFVLTPTTALPGDPALPEQSGAALAFIDDSVLTVATRVGGTNGTMAFLVHEEETGKTFAYGRTGPSSSALGNFIAVKFNERFFVLGTMDNGRVFEFSLRRKIPRDIDPSLTIYDDPGGTLLRATLSFSGAEGGEQFIVNSVLVKSTPIVPGGFEVVWSGQDEELPWKVRAGDRIEFEAELEQPSLEATIIDVLVTEPAGIATGSVKHLGTQRVRFTIDVTGNGIIKDLALNRQPLKAKGTILSVVVTDTQSKNRYKVRSLIVENQYINDSISSAIIAGSILSRLESSYPRLDGVQVWSPMHIRRFDRATVTDTRLGIFQQDFYIVSFTHRLNMRTDMKLVRVIPLP
ncbi:hypothetical protein LCGC14_0441350 [marine sediment metagenome]|uniref:Uncharacterized protein n=1 Tax=marine sediment metagenome TaxID=412755 RepID=A0A0F9VUJ3_9ZZZZ